MSPASRRTVGRALADEAPHFACAIAERLRAEGLDPRSESFEHDG